MTDRSDMTDQDDKQKAINSYTSKNIVILSDAVAASKFGYEKARDIG